VVQHRGGSNLRNLGRRLSQNYQPLHLKEWNKLLTYANLFDWMSQKLKEPSFEVISIYDSRNKRGLASMATSPASLGRQIGRADGLDRPILGHFAKKSLRSGKIQPAARPPLSEFLAKKALYFCTNATHRPGHTIGRPTNSSWADPPSALNRPKMAPEPIFLFCFFLFPFEIWDLPKFI
jgi:hypothetical protein